MPRSGSAGVACCCISFRQRFGIPPTQRELVTAPDRTPLLVGVFGQSRGFCGHVTSGVDQHPPPLLAMRRLAGWNR